MNVITVLFRIIGSSIVRSHRYNMIVRQNIQLVEYTVQLVLEQMASFLSQSRTCLEK